MSLEYRDQLKLVIIDKALIGLLILFAGFVFTISTVLNELRASNDDSDPYTYDKRAGYPSSLTSDILFEIKKSQDELNKLSAIHP